MSSTNYNYWEVPDESLKNTKTMENLMKAFAGESQARTRYNFTLLLPIRKVTDRLRLFLMKPPTMKGTCKKVLQISS